jgi:farnesyl diphosphate synthase
MDQSKTRRGRPCWYTLPEIGLQAINDGFIIDCGIDKVIRDTIPDHPHKETILSTIADAKFKTVIGQFLDGASTKIEHSEWDRYAQIVEHKTSHYSFFCPLAVGFQLADVLHYSNAYQKIAYDMGYMFQAQDDFLDVFGDEKITGKSSADIANGKCTWLSCRTVEKLSNDTKQFNILKENFGKAHAEHVSVVRELMHDSKIDKDFLNFQDLAVNKLHKSIEEFKKKEVRQLLHTLVQSLSGRKT